MGKEDKGELLGFLQAFDPMIQTIALELRNRVWDLYPDANELIYDGPAALAFGWSLSDRSSDVFLSLAIYNNKGVLFGFLRGSSLDDSRGLLEGSGKQYRYIRVDDLATFPEDYAFQLLDQSYHNTFEAAKKMSNVTTGQTIVKSVSAKKRRPPKHS